MNCTSYKLMLVGVLCIFISSTGQTYEISIAHDDSNNKEIMVTWYKDGSFSHDSIIHCGERTSLPFYSYEAATLYEISLSRDHQGKKHRTKLFPVFEGKVAVAHGVSNTYLWRLKMDGVYYSKDNDGEKLYDTWGPLEQKMNEIRLVYKNWDARKLHIIWNSNRNFHQLSRLEENSPYATLRYKSYTETTVYDISVKWNVGGVKYESKFFPVFSGTNAVHHEDTYIYFWYLKVGGVYFSEGDNHLEELYKTWPNIKRVYEIKLVNEILDRREVDITWNLNGRLHQHSRLDRHSVNVSVMSESCEEGTYYEISVGWNVDWMEYRSIFFPVFSGAFVAAYPYTDIYFWYLKEEGVYFGRGESRELRHHWSNLIDTLTTVEVPPSH